MSSLQHQLLLLIVVVAVTCVNSKRYTVIPQEALGEAHGILCEITADYKAAQPVHAHVIPICLPISQRETTTDLQRALAHYRNQMIEKYYRVSYETPREFKQRQLNAGGNIGAYDNQFCVDTEKSREIHEMVLKCPF